MTGLSRVDYSSENLVDVVLLIVLLVICEHGLSEVSLSVYTEPVLFLSGGENVTDHTTPLRLSHLAEICEPGFSQTKTSTVSQLWWDFLK